MTTLNASAVRETESDTETADFEEAKRVILSAIMRCLDSGIDPALVSAVLIGAGVSWYSRYHGEDAIVRVLSQTVSDIKTGRHRVDRWAQ
ncbi:MAG TPA: hypothetical protein VMB81_01550 [Candidatus Sulfotelmatobacter sp.]|nr:hypothetical protein [Candidatus Sulfotelmatobacter sp.]